MTRAQDSSMRGKEPVELETLDEFMGILGREGFGNGLSYIVKPSNITWKLRLMPGKQGAKEGFRLHR